MAAMIKIVTLGETQAHVVITTRQEYESFKNVTFLEKKSLQEVGNVPDKKFTISVLITLPVLSA